MSKSTLIAGIAAAIMAVALIFTMVQINSLNTENEVLNNQIIDHKHQISGLTQDNEKLIVEIDRLEAENLSLRAQTQIQTVDPNKALDLANSDGVQEMLKNMPDMLNSPNN